jgi:hypothetical protein
LLRAKSRRRNATRHLNRKNEDLDFLSTADANDVILQAHTWERHGVSTTPGFNGDVERAASAVMVRACGFV